VYEFVAINNMEVPSSQKARYIKASFMFVGVCVCVPRVKFSVMQLDGKTFYFISAAIIGQLLEFLMWVPKTLKYHNGDGKGKRENGGKEINVRKGSRKGRKGVGNEDMKEEFLVRIQLAFSASNIRKQESCTSFCMAVKFTFVFIVEECICSNLNKIGAWENIWT
jgi:hypothetical protein